MEDPADVGPYAAALREIDGAGGAVLVAELDGEVIGVCQLIVFRHLQANGGLLRRDRVGARAPGPPGERRGDGAAA